MEPERPTAIRSGLLSALILAVGLSGGLGGALGYSILRKDITILAAGKTVRHTTFRRTVAEALNEAQIRPRRGARGRLIAFLHPSAARGVLVELVQRPRA